MFINIKTAKNVLATSFLTEKRIIPIFIRDWIKDAMYFKIANSKGNKYLQLVESYRNEEGKPRQRLIANLCNISKCSEEDILKLCQSFLRTLGVEKIAFLDDLSAEESYDYGDVLPVISIWQQLNLGNIIQRCVSDRIKIDPAKATLIMVANKFVDPQSKLGAWLWYDRSLFKYSQEFEHVQPKGKGLVHTFYRTLDYLCDSQEQIEKELYYQLQCYGIDTELVLYDITSSYFEGEDAELGANGYSRDHRPDRPQIVIGVVTSKEGIPFAHYVFEGNTTDKTTVKQVINDLKKRFNITHCIFVGDRGMVSQINLDTIKDHEYDYIMGIRRHNSRIVKELLPFIKQNPSKELIEIKQDQIKDKKLKKDISSATRFVIGFNESVQQKVRETRERKFDQFKTFLSELSCEGELEEVTNSMTKVTSYLKQKRLKRYFSVSVEPSANHDSYRLLVNENIDTIEAEKLIDGHFFIQTEVKEQILSGNEVITSYKSLQKVERMFRVVKNNIELRPIYVRKKKRVRGHVFICFLTYLIECVLERAIKEKIPEQSLERIKIELARVKLVPVKLSNRITSKNSTLYFVTGGNSEIKKLYSSLKIRNFRHPETLYFNKKDRCTGNFLNQMSLFPTFTMN